MSQAPRISPDDARRDISENDAILVCAYDDQEKCGGLKLNGSISYPVLQQRLDGIGKDRELIFYCA